MIRKSPTAMAVELCSVQPINLSKQELDFIFNTKWSMAFTSTKAKIIADEKNLPKVKK
ncbi:hypothetical protein MYO4S_00024 [Serratia phage 4S]|nr:hypothetical protein MYO4S_00024 [Serratia phage 4S]